MTRTDGRILRLEHALLRPTDGTWLAAFRVLYGLALAISMLRFIAYGWIERFFVEPHFHFKYWGFQWVEPLSGPHMYGLFGVLTALAFCIAAGFAFRLCAPLFALGLSYFQLIDVSTYLNHYYLAALLAWLLAVSPAHRSFSVDAWIRARRRRSQQKHGQSTEVAAFWLYLFRFQVGIVYVFAGLAKAQGDWLVHAQPLRIWLGANSELPLLGRLFTVEGAPLLMSWCGFLFDTTIVLWLSIKKTRPYAYLLLLVFHALTRVLFPIGMFPVIMTLAALVFFEPDWPRRLLARLRRRSPSAVTTSARPAPPEAPSPLVRAALVLGALYCVVQLLMPVRFLAYGGNVLWHEQGMRLSWRVMLRAKGGRTIFIVRNKATGRTWHVSPDVYLTALQESEMSSQPDLILQLAHRIRSDAEQKGLGPVEVRVDARVSLNGRRSVPLVDPTVDLASVRDGVSPYAWVMPAPAASPPNTKIVL